MFFIKKEYPYGFKDWLSVIFDRDSALSEKIQRNILVY
jgi:hypothetical protein